MNIGFVGLAAAIPLSSASTWFLTPFQTSITEVYLSKSVIKPLWNCLLILSTLAWPASIYSCLCWLVIISIILNVIPEIVEYLNPKSLSLSSIIEVSVVL